MESAPSLDDDPLGAYLDEAAGAFGSKEVAPPPAAKPQPTPPPPAAKPPAPEMREPQLDDEGDDFGGEASDKPRVIVESGNRRQFGGGKPGGLSFGRPREEAKPAARPPAPPPPAPKAPERLEEPAAPRDTQPKRPEQPRREEPRREERRVESREEPRREEPRREERQAPPPRAAQPQRAVEQPRRVEAAPGRLHGWLVSYSDPDGRSIELREGKFFVTGSSLKESDLIIADKSISTPHALVSVGGESGLRMQDLMSDRGVFLRHGESGAYQRRDEPCTVEHGDWVRFGDVEFLVCLIAHVGAR